MKPLMLAAAIAAMTMTLAPAQPLLAQTKSGEAPAAQSGPNVSDFDKHLEQARERMAQMQALMEKLEQTQDPQERQKLLQEHWTAMQDAMSSMRYMWGASGCCGAGPGMGPGMMMGGPMMGWGRMRGQYGRMTPEQLRQRQYMLDQFMPMQQMMLEHMMWRQRWLTPPR